MSEALNDVTVDVVNDHVAEVITEKKRTREGKLRSKAWDHFTKLIQEDGTAEKCQCNHCHKLFTCAGKTGTTHLLRHITEGTCPVFHNKEKKERPHKIASSRKRNSELKYDQAMGQPSQQYGLQDDILPLDFDDFECQITESLEGGSEYVERSPMLMPRKLPQHPRGESWMNEVRTCVGRLAELTNVGVPNKRRHTSGAPPPPPPPPPPPDYSLAAAVRCLNEMEDIPQSSEIYLDAFEVLKDGAERECFICLPQEPRRRWLQRTLLRHFPLRYNHES